MRFRRRTLANGSQANDDATTSATIPSGKEDTILRNETPLFDFVIGDDVGEIASFFTAAISNELRTSTMAVSRREWIRDETTIC